MTEDEAKAKACCGSQGVAWSMIALQFAAENKAELVAEPPRCIGSGCMAWRVKNETKIERVVQTQRPVGEGWARGFDDDAWERFVGDILGGFCGLAGRPE